jgi:hypothetical protein
LRFAQSMSFRGRSFPIPVDENGHLRRVVVQFVVRRELVVPFQPARIGVESDDAVAVEVVPKPLPAVPIRSRIAGAEVHQICLCGS